jgi:hypothetical protein
MINRKLVWNIRVSLAESSDRTGGRQIELACQRAWPSVGCATSQHISRCKSGDCVYVRQLHDRMFLWTVRWLVMPESSDNDHGGALQLNAAVTGPVSPSSFGEEEVPQTGTRITVVYNRTRWRNDGAIVWLSTKRSAGRGEGSSGLAFDHLVDTPAAAQ